MRDTIRVQILIPVLGVMLVLLSAANTQAQGKLQQLRETIRTPSVKDDSRVVDSGNPCAESRIFGDRDDDDEFGFGQFFWDVSIAALTLPITGPIHTAQDQHSIAWYFSDYPYQQGIDGNMAIDPRIGETLANAWSFQIRSEYANDFDGLSRIGTRFLVDSTCRLGIDAEVNQWHEQLSGDQFDELWTGDTNLVYRFAQTDWMQMRVGPGVNWLADEIGTEFGFNLTYQGDFFPVRPWVVSLELDLGTLAGETLIHGRVTTGLHWKHVEVFTGFDYYQVDHTNLNGLLGGLRIWF